MNNAQIQLFLVRIVVPGSQSQLKTTPLDLGSLYSLSRELITLCMLSIHAVIKKKSVFASAFSDTERAPKR